MRMTLLNTPKSPLKIYKRIGIGFISLTAVLLLIVMYMALSRATIVVEPTGKPVSADLLLTVKEKDLRGGDILGKIAVANVSHEATFTASGDGVVVPSKAGGTITVYNNSTKNQTLMATTRFLSKDGILFRLKNEITVPAGGNIKAEIVADKEGASGEVAAGTFTIPGLSASLQTKIFGKSTEAMTGGTSKMAVVSEKDIDDAVKNLTSTLMIEAAEKLKTVLNVEGIALSNVAYKDVLKNKEVSVKAGDKAPNFKVKLDLDVIGVAYGTELQDQAAKTLSGMIASDRKLLSSNLMELKPVIEKYDLEDKSANIKIALTGNTVISADSPVFDRERLSGMSVDEVRQYLEKYAGIKSVDVKFFPFWVDKVPKLRDHVKVIVK